MFLLLQRVKYQKKVPLGTGTEFQVPIPVPVQMWTVPNPNRAALLQDVLKSEMIDHCWAVN